jgi:hypothetical protein
MVWSGGGELLRVVVSRTMRAAGIAFWLGGRDWRSSAKAGANGCGTAKTGCDAAVQQADIAEKWVAQQGSQCAMAAWAGMIVQGSATSRIASRQSSERMRAGMVRGAMM